MIKINQGEQGLHPSDIQETKVQKNIGQEETVPESMEAVEASEEIPSQEELLESLKRKDEEIAKLNEKLLRVIAEMDNMRKRLDREREDIILYGNEQLIRELLPVIDNLERALLYANKDSGSKELVEGVEITLKQFLGVLEKFGCQPIDSLGQPFDPRYHEALMQQETEEAPENTVIQEYQRGYILKGRLLRPARVVVAKSPVKTIN